MGARSPAPGLILVNALDGTQPKVGPAEALTDSHRLKGGKGKATAGQPPRFNAVWRRGPGGRTFARVPKLPFILQPAQAFARGRPRREMSEDTFVRVDVDDRIATITIDRQDKLNALNPQVVGQLDRAFESVRSDPDVGGVILTGAGNKAFVAGADIGVLAEMDSLTGVQVSRDGQEVLRRIETFPKPVVAAVGGYALGGGCELAIACHLRIASENARFGLPEVGLGIIPGYGGTVRLTRLIGLGRALEMVLTGEMVDGARAAELGLANAVVPPDELMSFSRAFLGKILEKGPVAVEMALKSVYLAAQSSMEDALTFESSLFGLLASTSDMKEGMQAFLEKRRAEFTGS